MITKHIATFALTTALLTTLSFPTYGGSKAPGETPHWGYTGDSGPSHWGDIDPSYGTCKTGQQQSPIDLKRDTHLVKSALSFVHSSTPLVLIDNGHTLKVTVEGNNSVSFQGETYKLLQFHYHTPSEHTVEGKRFPLEIHFVHQNQKGEYLAVGLLVEEGEANSEFAKIIANKPDKENETVTPKNTLISLKKLFKATGKNYQYAGSFTTPPCTEGVKWFVIDTPITFSKEQIETLSKVHPNNNRPIQ